MNKADVSFFGFGPQSANKLVSKQVVVDHHLNVLSIARYAKKVLPTQTGNGPEVSSNKLRTIKRDAGETLYQAVEINDRAFQSV